MKLNLSEPAINGSVARKCGVLSREHRCRQFFCSFLDLINIIKKKAFTLEYEILRCRTSTAPLSGGAGIAGGRDPTLVTVRVTDDKESDVGENKISKLS